MGDGGDNTITGTPQADMFVLSQGGDDTVSGLGQRRHLLFRRRADRRRQRRRRRRRRHDRRCRAIIAAGSTLDGSVTGDRVASRCWPAPTPPSAIRGRISTITSSPPSTTISPPACRCAINGAALLAGEDFTFDGSAETDAKFVVYGGRGTDDLTGGDGNDIFFFAEGGRFAAGDTVDGGGGYDGLFLRGNYTIDFTQAGYAGGTRRTSRT